MMAASSADATQYSDTCTLEAASPWPVGRRVVVVVPAFALDENCAAAVVASMAMTSRAMARA